MDVAMGYFDKLKEIVLQATSTMSGWQWVLIALGGYKIWDYYQRYIPIPTYGGILSFSRVLSTIRLSRLGPEAFVRFYSEYPMILLPRLEFWTVFVQPRFLDEILKAPEDVLSFLDATFDSLQVQYTLGKRFLQTQDHHNAIQHQLTRHLPALSSEVSEEIQVALAENLNLEGHEWKKVHAWPFVLQVVARASNRIFVGVPLCRNKKWLDFNLDGPSQVVGISLLLNLFPKWMLPILGPVIGPAERRIRKAQEMVGPLIQERLNTDPSNWPDDFITWLLINAPESDRTVVEIIRRLIVVNFAAIHTSSLNLGHALYWLLARPHYIGPLREEIEEAVERMGWTKEALGHMPKLESFMKECMRMTPLGAVSVTRKVLKPFTFSNGVTVPSGTYLAVHMYATHHDGAFYERPEEFDGFRFVEEKKTGGDDTRKSVIKPPQTMYATSKTWLAFGHGRHACPGRFFASLELKMLMAYMIVNYDMKWPEEDLVSHAGVTEQGYRPPNHWFNYNSVPNQKAHIMFRKRI